MPTQRLCLAVEQWPAVDRDLWRAGIAPAALFEAAGAGASWSARTRDKFERDYGRWLAWLADQGLLDAAQPPAARVNRDRVTAYVRDLEQTSAPHTVTGRVQGLRDALRVLAPGGDWAWLTGAHNALRRRAEPIHDKRARLRSSVSSKGAAFPLPLGIWTWHSVSSANASRRWSVGLART